MSEELKPCPFCGGEAIGYEWSDDMEIEGGEHHRDYAYCAVKVNHKDDCVLEVGEFYFWVASSEEEAAVLWNRRAERTWHDFADELPPEKKPVLCKGRNGALYVGKPVTFVDGTRTREVWVPRGDQYRNPEKWMEIGE